MTSELHQRTIGSLRAVPLDAPDIDRLAAFYELDETRRDGVAHEVYEEPALKSSLCG